MKKFLFAASLFLTMSAFATPTAVNEKVLSAFNQVFKNAQGTVWYEEDGNFRVSFKQDEVAVRIVYDKDGNMLQSLRYYTEEQLPMLIRANLKKEFAGKKVFGVTEHTSATNTEYYITLEDEKTWTMVTADAMANLTITKKFKKA